MPRKNTWGWYRPNPAPQARAGSYRRKYGTSWWGKEFLAALQRMDYSGRLSRGQTYANKGLVENIQQPRPGKLTAEVQGSQPRPYRVRLDWTPWPTTQAGRVLQAIRDNPALHGQLLTGTLPPELLEVVRAQGLTLFPQEFTELNADCSCPDWAVPCKHMAAVFYVMAGAIDADPFELFRMRGLDLREALTPPEEEANDAVPELTDLLQPVAGTPIFNWDEALATSIDFGHFADQGWEAVRRLPEQPAFDAGGDFQAFLNKVYTQSARYASKLWKKEATAPVTELLPPATQLELHLDADLHLIRLAAYDEQDEARLDLTTDAALLDWLQQIEQLEPHLLNKEARSLLLAFQLARTQVQRKSLVPALLHDAPDTSYLIQYLPVATTEELTDTLQRFDRLVAPTLLYVEREEFYEFRSEQAGRQLLAALMGCMIREATAGMEEDNPARRLFLLRGRQRFTLVGTEGFGEAVHRYLGQLHLADQRFSPVVRVVEVDDGLSVDVLVHDREQADKSQPPVPLGEWLTGAERADRLRLIKTLSFLAGHFPQLSDYLAAQGAGTMHFSVHNFTPVLTAVLPSMEALGIRVLLPAPLRKLLRPQLGLIAQTKPGTQVFELSGIVSLHNILQFNWQLALGDQFLSKEEFMQLAESAGGLVRWKEQYVMLDRTEVARLIDKLAAGQPELKPHERLQALFTEEYEGGPVRLGPELTRLITRLREGSAPATPPGLNATLRPYQERGYAWLHTNAALGFGSVLADDMGLGKTLQVITLLLKYVEEGLLEREKAIVIVPTSLLGNWQREIARFAPALTVHLYHGSTRNLPDDSDYHVLLTTYGVVRSEEGLAKLSWRVAVIDEAQAIKNPSAKQTRAVKKIKAAVRIAMSGTPVENRLLDYWSLLDYTLPKFLGSRKYFNEQYGRPIQGEHDRRVAARFQRLTAPFVLRRLKTDRDIITDLPDKVVQTEHCALTPEQTALYQSVIAENMRRVEQSEGIGRQGLILKLITALKQVCNHPAQFLKRGAADFGQSGKAELLRERLTSILENGDKALIFTQYREMGELLQQMIRKEFGLETPFLHGGSSTKQRDEMVDRFQTDSDTPLLLVSIKAGGTGLNLTAANHVIHYDLWWNPAVEAQATDRAYRIGQERTVFVHRLVTAATFEEKIDQLIQSKRDLADLSVVEGERSLGGMGNRELGELMRLQ